MKIGTKTVVKMFARMIRMSSKYMETTRLYFDIHMNERDWIVAQFTKLRSRRSW